MATQKASKPKLVLWFASREMNLRAVKVFLQRLRGASVVISLNRECLYGKLGPAFNTIEAVVGNTIDIRETVPYRKSDVGQMLFVSASSREILEIALKFSYDVSCKDIPLP
jgi:hypothetical protein